MFPYSELFTRLNTDILKELGKPPNGFISSDMDLREANCASLRDSFFKKLEPNGVSSNAAKAALEKFLGINASISTEPFVFGAVSEIDSIFWDYFQEIFSKTTLGEEGIDLAFIGDHFSVGPGASLKCRNDSFYTKCFDSSISYTTPRLLSLYRAITSFSDSWAYAEKQRSLRFGELAVAGNQLFFVEKTTDIARTCCTEPFANMLFQQGIGAYLEKCLDKQFGISLSTEAEHNQELARIGSIDGSFGTIDLQSASDSISWALVKRICPGGLLGYLRESRSEVTTLPNGDHVPLNMISTMGNGFTFPLQTVIFACAVRTVYTMMGLDPHRPDGSRAWGVFGDDIVVRKDCYNYLVHVLGLLGFKVNDSKSFNTGSFRESCGKDYFSGNLVRGVYIRTLETVSAVYSAINRLHRWSGRTGCRLHNTIRFLYSFVPKRERRLIPFSEAIDSGIQVPFNRTRPIVSDSYCFLYKKLLSISRKAIVPLNRESALLLGYKDFNPYGWELCFLGGYARTNDVPIELQHSREFVDELPKAFLGLRDIKGLHRYKVVRCSIPYWDWLGPEATALTGTGFSFAVWEDCLAI